MTTLPHVDRNLKCLYRLLGPLIAKFIPFIRAVIYVLGSTTGSKVLGVSIVTSLAKEVMFLVALVCLSVCLSVNNITQKVMNGLG